MHYNQEYVKQLEDTIMDDILPMYLVGCRSVGIDPRMNKVLERLVVARALKEEVPALLRKDFDMSRLIRDQNLDKTVVTGQSPSL